MPIGLYRELETPQPRDFIEAVNSLNDNSERRMSKFFTALRNPTKF
ncbi:MAG: hypothetical protein CM1200mP39_19710 [Dehalococcoidia bacterium]|nr:MAG: hypothetical protein CM1200mP39_19710 [Dehalococcoidia bacterium]